jgi:hypothetical protein
MKEQPMSDENPVGQVIQSAAWPADAVLKRIRIHPAHDPSTAV